jgi:hypothetical protein
MAPIATAAGGRARNHRVWRVAGARLLIPAPAPIEQLWVEPTDWRRETSSMAPGHRLFPKPGEQLFG